MSNIGNIRPRSLTRQSADLIRERIRSGEIGPTLPGENELARMLDVSRPTIRGALELLEQEGVVTPSIKGVARLVNNPLIPALRSGHRLFQRPSHRKQSPSSHSGKGDKGDPVLYAATEFKSQDKSIGNNQNNRIEESIGNAADFWATYQNDGFLRQLPRPWLGYLFVGKYDPASDNKSVKIKQPHFEAMPPFQVDGSSEKETYEGPSYAERYKIFLKQSVGSRLYDAGAFIVTDERISTKRPNHRIPLEEFGSANFLRSLKAQILAHYPGAKPKKGSLASKI